MISAGFAAGALLVLIYVNFIRPLLRRRRLRAPCKMAFVITTLDRRILGYVKQDTENEHLVKKLVIDAESTVIMEILFTPRLRFEIAEMEVGFDGGKNRHARPAINKYINRFIQRGQGQEDTPETNPNHYIDHHGHYHIRRANRYSVGTDHVVGFEIKTGEPGDYSVVAMFIGDEVEGFLRLPFEVRKDPSAKIKCTRKGKKHRNCYLVFDPSAAQNTAMS
jgi:hypothetical protein